ncbi:threonine synthase [Alicyclobacillus mengziensis]|uniref:Pyridoxal-phosphate dependent enzyme n=1 Tax=Alicyclobacillus mengziensis TaxID=2931921 RepID=A0A9X7VXA0_9BACL|nr:pyridoxal-phosphate dependent enzyme [Alicyclobacillus mengziensis]QSO46704.1 pyridoxal-phosphate dependent enzyme [Alicyclobacillus mengziensis]
MVAAPRLAARLGLKSLLLKDETRNPTRCLKDRATAIAVTLATANGYRDMYCASAGNAAISLAGFCANHGLGCHVFVPSEASQTRLNWLRRYGADIHVSTGNYDQAYDEAERAGAENGWYSRNCAFNPFLVEGKKTVAFEMGEQLGWQAPDLIVAPVGDGCTLGAIGKGFRELEAVGLTDEIPQLIGIQSEAIQPLVRRHRGDDSGGDNGNAQAASIAVRRPRNTLRLLSEIRLSNGLMLGVSDEHISSAQRTLAEEAGVVAEFTSAAALAGLIQLAEHESLENKSAVLVITGGRLDSDF